MYGPAKRVRSGQAGDFFGKMERQGLRSVPLTEQFKV
jgi:hypothetical protein